MSDIVLVTGAAHGIGFEVVRQLAERGMTVILTARDAGKGGAAAVETTKAAVALAYMRASASGEADVNLAQSAPTKLSPAL